MIFKSQSIFSHLLHAAQKKILEPVIFVNYHNFLRELLENEIGVRLDKWVFPVCRFNVNAHLSSLPLSLITITRMPYSY